MNTQIQNISSRVAALPKTTGAGLYVHIPFCEHKCEYCDFYSLTQLEQMEQFVAALIREIELRAPGFREEKIQTIFFGGGTPSLLTPLQLHRIWQKIRECFQILPDAECTIESNPGTLSPEKLAAFREVGFNRLSMGVQSFHPAELRFLGRIHSVEQVLENFQHARNAGFRNINIDLMTAFPGITPESFRRSLTAALQLSPEHISCYTLIFEPGTVFYKRMLKGELQPLEESEEAEYYQLAARTLEEQGYIQYEISNFAQSVEQVCRHNLIYWRHRPYFGFGPSAHSFYRNQRFANKRSLAVYLKSLSAGELPVDFQETLSEEQQMFEYIFLHLRLKEGVNLSDFSRRFGVDFVQHYATPLQRLARAGLIEMHEGHLRLSPRGWMVADTVATYF